jgi:hypothetical protein
MGEVIALTFLPLVFIGMYELIFGNPRGNKYLILGLTGLINSHMLSVEISVILCVIFALANIKRLLKPERLAALFEAVAIFLLVNLWVIFPLFSMAAGLSVTGSKPEAWRDAVYPTEMFATYVKSFGLSGDIKEAFTGMPLSVGGVLGLGALLFLAGLFIFNERGIAEHNNSASDDWLRHIGKRALIVALTALFFASTLFPWREAAKIPLLGNVLVSVQFPWRYFGAASAALCFVLAVGFTRAFGNGAHRRLAGFLVIAVLLAGSAPYIDAYMQTWDHTVTIPNKLGQTDIQYLGGQEYFRPGTDKGALDNLSPTVKLSSSGMFVTDFSRAYGTFEFELDIPYGFAGEWFELPLYYYPGYRAELDNGVRVTELPVAAGTNGVLRAELPGGTVGGHVCVYYREPLFYRLSEFVSLVTVLALLCLYLLPRLRRARVRQK